MLLHWPLHQYIFKVRSAKQIIKSKKVEKKLSDKAIRRVRKIVCCSHQHLYNLSASFVKSLRQTFWKTMDRNERRRFCSDHWSNVVDVKSQVIPLKQPLSLCNLTSDVEAWKYLFVLLSLQRASWDTRQNPPALVVKCPPQCCGRQLISSQGCESQHRCWLDNQVCQENWWCSTWQASHPCTSHLMETTCV